MRSRSGAFNLASIEELIEEMKRRDEDQVSITIDHLSQLRLDEQELELMSPVKPLMSTAKILVLGAAGVGKTSLVRRFISKDFVETYESNSGMEVKVQLAAAGARTTKFEIWDAPTRAPLAPLVKSYYASVKAFLIVFDLTSQLSLEFALKIMVELPCATPRVLVGNKVDRATEFDRSHAREVVGLVEAGYIETSARTGYNIDGLFLDLAANC